jgi:hypothetical protein
VLSTANRNPATNSFMAAPAGRSRWNYYRIATPVASLVLGFHRNSGGSG